MTNFKLILSLLLFSNLCIISPASAKDVEKLIAGTWYANKEDINCTGNNKKEINRDAIGLGNVRISLHFYGEGEYMLFTRHTLGSPKIHYEETTEYTGTSKATYTQTEGAFTYATLTLNATKYKRERNEELVKKLDITEQHDQRIALTENDSLYVFGHHVLQLKEIQYLRLCDKDEKAFIKFKKAEEIDFTVKENFFR